jgi:hypothetical protein
VDFYIHVLRKWCLHKLCLGNGISTATNYAWEMVFAQPQTMFGKWYLHNQTMPEKWCSHNHKQYLGIGVRTTTNNAWEMVFAQPQTMLRKWCLHNHKLCLRNGVHTTTNNA